MTAKKQLGRYSSGKTELDLSSLLNGGTNYMETLKDLFKETVHVDLDGVPESVSLVIDNQSNRSVKLSHSSAKPKQRKQTLLRTVFCWTLYIFFLIILCVILYPTILRIMQENQNQRIFDTFVPPNISRKILEQDQ